MFSRLTTMLAEMTGQALAPAPEQHKGEEFKLHWKSVTTLLVNYQDDKTAISETALPAHLNSMVDLLCYEEERESDRMGPSMEFLLQHKVLETLQTLSKTNCPVGIRDQVLRFYTLLLSRLQSPILPQVSVHKTLQRVIKTCGEVDLDSTTAFSEIQLLRTVCSRLESHPFMAEFFVEKTDSQRNFLIVDALLKLVQHKDNLVIVKAYECLLLCTGLKDPAIAKTIGEHTKLPLQLVTNMNSHFSFILPSTPAHTILSCPASWGSCQLVGGVGLSSEEHMEAFLCWVDYCNQLISSSQPELVVIICQAIEEHLLERCIKTRLLEDSEEDLLMLTAVMVRLLQITTSSHTLQNSLVKFLVGENDAHSLRQKLVQNCNHINDEVSLATLQLFDVILSLPISLTHLIASSGEGSVDDTPYSPTSHVDSREHLQKTVESFLSIVPPDLCSAAYEESGDLGYNTYLLEAQARFSRFQQHCAKSSATPTHQQLQSLSNFTSAMFNKLEHMLDQSLELNLMLTSLLNKILLHLPVYLEAILINTNRSHTSPMTSPVRSSMSPSPAHTAPSLYHILNKVSQDLQSRVAHSPTLPVNIAEARKRLQGHDVSDLLSMPHNDLVEGAVVLEEFCKEVACLLFVKWTTNTLNTVQ
ncbi:FHF complex subunit HOOK interacting protein 2A-like [Dysidea avara]|uniref:FHF complex subunit HOOK interacting protein 2A-like n=1 Tax=Dysidea avara TaxID=196820 RepID=UPI0033299669